MILNIVKNVNSNIYVMVVVISLIMMFLVILKVK